MGTHPIFESDFDCLTEQKMGDTGTSFLLDDDHCTSKTVFSPQDLTLGVVELGLATFMAVNVFFHLCARDWGLKTFIFNVATCSMEVVASILAIILFVSDASVTDDTAASVSDSVNSKIIVIYVAVGLSALRMVFAMVAFCKNHRIIKQEKGSKWDLFWPTFEILVSVLSCL